MKKFFVVLSCLYLLQSAEQERLQAESIRNGTLTTTARDEELDRARSQIDFHMAQYRRLMAEYERCQADYGRHP